MSQGEWSELAKAGCAGLELPGLAQEERSLPTWGEVRKGGVIPPPGKNIEQIFYKSPYR